MGVLGPGIAFLPQSFVPAILAIYPMTRIRYVPYNPRADRAAVIEHAVQLVAEYAEQGFRLTLRQLYYQYIARDLFPDSWINREYNAKHGLPELTKNTLVNYHRLSDILKRAREAGMLEWESIVDRLRNMYGPETYTSPQELARTLPEKYTRDLWAGQPKRVEVWVEKDALVEFVQMACEPLGMDYFPNRGYVSCSTIWDIAHNRHKHNWDVHKQATVVLHLGDHDPSGFDMTRDIEERCRLYSTPYEDGEEPIDITFIRLGLSKEQVDEFGFPPNPAKVTDSRAKKYIEEHGTDSWELDVLSPDYVINLIQTEAKKHILKPKLMEAEREKQAKGRQLLGDLVSQWDPIAAMVQSGIVDLQLEDDRKISKSSLEWFLRHYHSKLPTKKARADVGEEFGAVLEQLYRERDDE